MVPSRADGFSGPAIPAFGRHLDPRVAQLHSSADCSADDVPRGHVVVVGAGNTGVQIAGELADGRVVEPDGVVWATGCGAASLRGRGSGRTIRGCTTRSSTTRGAPIHYRCVTDVPGLISRAAWRVGRSRSG